VEILEVKILREALAIEDFNNTLMHLSKKIQFQALLRFHS